MCHPFNILSAVYNPHSKAQSVFPPLVYALLPNKQHQTYSRAFLSLKDAALSLGITLDPDMLMSDFELALIQATALNFPNASHKGCYYHFKQAIWRKVQSLGLVEEYKSSDEVC